MRYCKITNKINGKVYIGQTTRTMEARWKEHVEQSRNPRAHFHFAIQKYGAENFIGEILYEACSQHELDEKETEYGLLLNALVPTGYNLRLGSGSGSRSDALRRKQAQAQRGVQAGAAHYFLVNTTLRKLKRKFLAIAGGSVEERETRSLARSILKPPSRR